MEKSPSELGVLLKADADSTVVSRKPAVQSRGILEDLPNAPTSSMKILRVRDAAGLARIRRGLGDEEPAIEQIRPVYRFPDSDAPVMGTGEIIVKLRGDLSPAEQARLWEDLRLEVVDQAEGLSEIFRVRPIDMDADPDEILVAETLNNDSRIRWAQPNLRRTPVRRQAAPSDEFFPFQWHLNNSGQLGGLADADIDAPEAWLLAEGQGVLIGMFDDACDVDHEDLRENFIGIGHDPTRPSNDPTGGFRDPRPKIIGDRHGTAVMGLAVARANQLGVRGVAYLSNFTASRGFGGGVLTDFDIASVFTFARQQNVDVHLNSWGVTGPNSAVIEEAILTALELGRPIPGGVVVDDDEPPPARGMVIVWASGNDGIENLPGFDYSTIPGVIGVGASDDRDRVASYSNFGKGIDVLAPGGGATGPPLTTTDNEDLEGRVDQGFNVNGSELDAAGKYTNSFAGTSASCPLVAGTAALILSRNPQLTADDVRLILQHTSDAVSSADAQYHGVTRRSVRYGYGRINAHQAVIAAGQAAVNGGFSWPERPFNVQVEITNAQSGVLNWQSSVGTTEFLIVESDNPFTFSARDGECYDQRQIGCGAIALSSLPGGVTVRDVISCGSTGCELGDDQQVTFTISAGVKHLGLFARNTIGRYAFGVSATSDGEVLDEGPVLAEPGSGGELPGGGGTVEGPRVTISATPMSGTSPLTVRFMGNAVSTRPIDESRTAWDFDASSGNVVPDATTRNATHTYTVADGVTQTFLATLTMFDVDGNSGTASVMIRVTGQTQTGGGGAVGAGDLIIRIRPPGVLDREISEGKSPLSVELSIDASAVDGVLQTVLWDLGDGDMASSLVVPHVYENVTSDNLVIPVSATVTIRTAAGATLPRSATRFLTILPGDPAPPPVEPPCFGPTCPQFDGNGGGGTGMCGPVGMIPLFLMMTGLFLIRHRCGR